MATLEELKSLTLEELKNLASDRDIEGRSSMNKDELAEALADGQPQLQDLDEVDPDGTLSDRMSAMENRLAAIEARLGAVDERTRASTQPYRR